ncbi:TPA: hypothetical protein ACUB60_005483 [Klebsiella variicola]|uniref:Uncharacterized protein n=1 Tax=Klebsiella quasipneumoniae TaxID=1463165 RepID=A0A8I0DGB5_9ENTR|nr:MULTISPECIES: hypothetical protein [Klebsiella]ELS4551048.1 hypothetical protein [Klebsiella michiganensis]AZJ07662.1 hypothetical protein BME54_27925 [Klebsiella quasipneumoniae]AZJ30803.1 hypothetical protein BME36_028605 [Klebsiella quasipneumoniae subsp. similipneumoniae]EKR5521435.1 hypothetical protein [Klebsiella pneumoniae]EKU2796627.1 hypothetical protein [Klebsiella variicola]
MANFKSKNFIRRELRLLRGLRSCCVDDRELMILDNKIRVLEKLLDDIVMEEYNPLSTRFDNWN